MNVANEKLLEKIWINVYDSRLTDEQTCRLAAKHNTDNHGSRQTSWMERVATCRNWLFKKAKADPEHDAVPASSTAWKKACQQMYMGPGKVKHGYTVSEVSVEKHVFRPPANVFNLFFKVIGNDSAYHVQITQKQNIIIEHKNRMVPTPSFTSRKATYFWYL